MPVERCVIWRVRPGKMMSIAHHFSLSEVVIRWAGKEGREMIINDSVDTCPLNFPSLRRLRWDEWWDEQLFYFRIRSTPTKWLCSWRGYKRSSVRFSASSIERTVQIQDSSLVVKSLVSCLSSKGFEVRTLRTRNGNYTKSCAKKLFLCCHHHHHHPLHRPSIQLSSVFWTNWKWNRIHPLLPFTVAGSHSFNRFSTTITVKHPLHQVATLITHIPDSPHSGTTTTTSNNNNKHITGNSPRVGEREAAVLAVAIHLVLMWTAVLLVRNMLSPRPQLTSRSRRTNSTIIGTVSIIRTQHNNNNNSPANRPNDGGGGGMKEAHYSDVRKSAPDVIVMTSRWSDPDCDYYYYYYDPCRQHVPSCEVNVNLFIGATPTHASTLKHNWRCCCYCWGIEWVDSCICHYWMGQRYSNCYGSSWCDEWRFRPLVDNNNWPSSTPPQSVSQSVNKWASEPVKWISR